MFQILPQPEGRQEVLHNEIHCWAMFIGDLALSQGQALWPPVAKLNILTFMARI